MLNNNIIDQLRKLHAYNVCYRNPLTLRINFSLFTFYHKPLGLTGWNIDGINLHKAKINTSKVWIFGHLDLHVTFALK